METTGSGIWLWFVLVAGAAIGYIIVSKVIDFYMKGSTFESNDQPVDVPENGTIGGVDPTKPIG